MLKLKQRIFRHMLSLDVTFFDKNPVGRLMARVESDTESLRLLFTNTVVLVVADLLVLVGVYSVMFYYSPGLTSVLAQDPGPIPASPHDQVVELEITAEDEPAIEGRGPTVVAEYEVDFDGTLHVWTDSEFDLFLRVDDAAEAHTWLRMTTRAVARLRISRSK